MNFKKLVWMLFLSLGLSSSAFASNGQLDRMEDKLDRIIRSLDKMDGTAKHSPYVVVSEVIQNCLDKLLTNSMNLDQGLEVTEACRTLKMDAMGAQCNVIERKYNPTCVDKLMRNYYNAEQKATLVEACMTLKIRCE